METGDPIHDVPSDISEGHGVSGLSCFQSNHEVLIHDIPSNISEGHGVSGLLCFQSNNLN